MPKSCWTKSSPPDEILLVDVKEPVVAIVVAAGSGARLGGGVPKALRLVGGMSLVARSVAALAVGGVTHAVVVIPAGFDEDFRRALASSPIGWTAVHGGAERQDSVRNGLDRITRDPELKDTRIVLIHDAARALVPPAVVARVIAAVQSGHSAVVPVVAVVDSIRRVDDSGSHVADRTALRAVQTPQGFDLAVVQRAHQHVTTHQLIVTDDAAACEALGVAITLVDGDREAMKITEPLDLVMAEAIVKGR